MNISKIKEIALQYSEYYVDVEDTNTLFDGYKVYRMIRSPELKGKLLGLPTFILVKGETTRRPEPDEVFEIIRLVGENDPDGDDEDDEEF